MKKLIKKNMEILENYIHPLELIDVIYIFLFILIIFLILLI